MTRMTLTALFALVPLAATADITGFCRALPGTDAAQCSCATEKLRSQMAGSEVALYDAVTSGYLQNRAAGQGWLKAWRASVDAVANRNGLTSDALKARLKVVGDTHRALGDTCK